MKEIKFIHTADLHLDSPFVGLNHLPKTIFKRIQESTFTSFLKIVDAAITLKVDFVLICGDLFDGEDRSIKAQARLRKQLERLDAVGIAVFMSYGNHDHLSGNWTKIQMPNNVQIFSSEVEMKELITQNGTKVHIYGFSYPERHVMVKKIDEFKRIDGADLHIGMLHGQCEGGSSLHQPYAPFTVRDLLEKRMDYWALGHIHQQQTLHKNPAIIYPGNIQGRNRKEVGAKGCFSVSLSDHETDLQFIETADITWKTLNISAEHISSFSNLFLLCKKEIESSRLSNQGVLLDIQIKNTDQLDTEILEKVRNGELLEVLQDGEEIEEAFVWPYRIEFIKSKTNNFSLMDQSFNTELKQSIGELNDNRSFNHAIDDLFSHVYGSRYLDKISNQEKTELLDEAEQIVSQILKSNL